MTCYRSFLAYALAALGLVALEPALAQETADAAVKRTSQELLQIIRADPKV